MSDRTSCRCPSTWPEVRVVLNWLMINTRDADIHDHESTSKVIEWQTVPDYWPGLNLVFIPEAGKYCGYYDVGFIAVLVYFFGSILYLADSIYICSEITYNPLDADDFSNPAVYLNTWAAIVFVGNALLCFLDWWLQLRQMGAMNMYVDVSIPNKLFFTRITPRLSAYYFYNNIFFMSAALVYVVQGLLPGLVTLYDGDYFVSFWGSFLYLCSGTCSFLEHLENIRQRKLWNMPKLYLFTLRFREIDWYGWGDVLYASLSLFLFVTVFVETSQTVANNLYLIESVLFLLNSLAYTIGYVLYMLNLRADMLRSLGKDKASPTPSVTSSDDSCYSGGSPSRGTRKDLESASCVELTALQDREALRASLSQSSLQRAKVRQSPSHVVGDSRHKHNTANTLFHKVSDQDTAGLEDEDEDRCPEAACRGRERRGSSSGSRVGRRGSNSRRYQRLCDDEEEEGDDGDLGG